MTDEEIFRRIRDIIVLAKSASLTIDQVDVTPQSGLGEFPLAMDSIDFVSMIIGIEEAFGIIAEDEDFLATTMTTVGDVVGVVRQRLDAQQVWRGGGPPDA